MKRIYIVVIALFFSLLKPIYAQPEFSIEQECISNTLAYDLYYQALKYYSYNEKRSFNLFEETLEANPDFVSAIYYKGVITYQRAQSLWEEVVELEERQAPFSVIEDTKNKYNEQVRRFDEFFHDVIRLEASFNDYMSYYFLGKQYFNEKNYPKALQYLKEYITPNSEYCDEMREASTIYYNIIYYDSLLQNPVPFEPHNVEKICTENDEVFPLISPDGMFIFYTYRYKQRVRNSPALDDVEVFSYAPRLTPLDHRDEIYELGIPMQSPPFNDGRNQGAATITIDNKHLYITICELMRRTFSSVRNCDIYYSQKVEDKWTNLERLGENINGANSWEAQPSITADGRVLFFASNRTGGYGGTDIYQSIKDSLGNWGPAINLGPEINTAGNDKSPYIHQDGHTLYFATDGRFGLGGYDLFFTYYMGNGHWSPPKNIGYPINTENDELGIVVNTQGNKFYFSSNGYSTFGGYDIFVADLYEEARPEKVLFVTGRLQNQNGEPVKNAMVELQNTTTLKLTRGLVDPITGQYAIAEIIKEGDEFIITAKRAGMYFDSKYIDPTQSEYDFTAKIDFELKNIEVGTVFILDNIYFETASYQLDSKSIVTLNNFLEFLEINPTLKITLYGHTDNVGTDESNLLLSENRAKAVFEYLVEHNIDIERLSYKGFGESKPIATNSTKKGRSLNRRTEFLITVK